MCQQCEGCCRRPLRNTFSKVRHWSVDNGRLVLDVKSEKFLILGFNITVHWQVEVKQTEVRFLP